MFTGLVPDDFGSQHIKNNMFCEAGDKVAPVTVDPKQEPLCEEMSKSILGKTLSSVLIHAFNTLGKKLPNPKEDEHKRQQKPPSKKWGDNMALEDSDEELEENDRHGRIGQGPEIRVRSPGS